MNNLIGPSRRLAAVTDASGWRALTASCQVAPSHDSCAMTGRVANYSHVVRQMTQIRGAAAALPTDTHQQLEHDDSRKQHNAT